MDQISNDQWKSGSRKWREFFLGSIKRTASELQRDLDLSFATEWEDGLGPVSFAFCRTSTGRSFALAQYLEAPISYRAHTSIVVKEFEAEGVLTPNEFLDDILEDMNLASSDLAWMNEVVKFQPFQLWRQDDNGHRMVVSTFRCRADATAAMRRFESHQHRQSYWIEPSSQGSA